MTTGEMSVVEEQVGTQEGLDPTEIVDNHDRPPRGLKRFTAKVKALASRKMRSTVVVLLAAASIVLAGSLVYFVHLPDRHTDAAAGKTAIAAASDGTVAILSYSPDTLDRDFSAAKSYLTGDFLTYYQRFTQQIVGPAAKQKSVKTSAVVLRAALSELRPNASVVLLFVNQTTQSADRPEPTLTSSSVLVKMTKVSGRWLISSFDPV